MRAKICAIVASCCLMATFATGAQAATINHSSRITAQGPVSVQYNKPGHHGGPVHHHGQPGHHHGPVHHHGQPGHHHGPVHHHGQQHHGPDHGHGRV